MKKILLLLVVALLVSGVAMPAVQGQTVEITYWQYEFESKTKIVDELIKVFEERNPGIKVKHETFPYDHYNTRVATAVPAGEGPNVINLFYGWLPLYIGSGYLQPLPGAYFDPATIEAEFFPLATAGKVDGQYYALPTAVRSLALFWNKTVFKEAGLDPEVAPTTLDEMLDMAKRITKRDKGDNLVTAGLSMQLNSQVHNWFREVLVRQFGGVPYSIDNRTVTYNSQAGFDALQFIVDLELKHKVGENDFYETDYNALTANAMGMAVLIPAFISRLAGAGVDFGITELPVHNGVQSNYASYWANGITSFTKGAELEASAKFLQFLTSTEVMEMWVERVGELPAKPEAAAAFREHPTYGPFVRGLDYAHATYFVNESGQRQIVIDAFNRMALQNWTAEKALNQAAQDEQRLITEYYK